MNKIKNMESIRQGAEDKADLQGALPMLVTNTTLLSISREIRNLPGGG